jgi:hypothetical protein
MPLPRIITPSARRAGLLSSGRPWAALLLLCLLPACQQTGSGDAPYAGPSLSMSDLIQQDVAAIIAGMHHADIVLGSLDQEGTPKASQPAPISR